MQEKVMKRKFLPLLLLLSLSLFFGCSALRQAAESGNASEVTRILNKGTHPDTGMGDGRGYTALQIASFHGHLDVVKILVDRGADVNKADIHGDTALSSAAYGGHVEIVKYLIEKGADIHRAIDYLQPLAQKGGLDSKRGIRILQKYLDDQNASKQPIAQQSLTKEDIASVVKAAVEDATKQQKKDMKRDSSVQSDIDKPAFDKSEKIIGDNDLAVIIGIEGYSSLPKSDYSYDDARLVKDYVKALGFKERNIEFITDEKATLSGITKSIEAWLRNKAKSDSRIFIYYSGHGAPDPATGEAYIVPYDGDPNYLAVTGYPLKTLYSRLGQLQVKEVVVILDACFSGAGGRSVLAKGARPLVMVADTITLSSNMAILTATQGSQISTSSPEKGHGVFTYYFLKALRDGKKNLSEIYEYIKPQVEDEAKQLNVQQSPSISPIPEKIVGRFSLRK
jgi:hypothetical protein